MIFVGCSAAASVIRGVPLRFAVNEYLYFLLVVIGCAFASPWLLADASETPEERLQSHEKALVEGDCRNSRETAARNMLRISKEDLAVAKESRKFPSVVLMLTWHEFIDEVNSRNKDGGEPVALGSHVDSWKKVIREQLQISPPASWLRFCRESQLVNGALRGSRDDYKSAAVDVSNTERPGVSWIEDPVLKSDIAASIRRTADSAEDQVVRLPEEVIAELLADAGLNSGSNVSAAVRDDQLFILIPTNRNAFPIGHDLYCLKIPEGHNQQFKVAETVWHKRICNDCANHVGLGLMGGKVLVVTELRISSTDVFVFSGLSRTVSIESFGRTDGRCHVTFSHLPGLSRQESLHREDSSLPDSEDHKEANHVEH